MVLPANDRRSHEEKWWQNSRGQDHGLDSADQKGGVFQRHGGLSGEASEELPEKLPNA